MNATDPHSVLVADDDPAALALFGDWLESAGYRVLTAENGERALQLLLEHGTPLVIADLDMPGMNGMKLCTVIRDHEGIGFAHVMVVASVDSSELMISAFDAGADDFLAKPVDRREFLARVRDAERVITMQADIDQKNRALHQANARLEVVNMQFAAANDRLRFLATTDELTGLGNRRASFTRLAEQWSQAIRQDSPLSCLMLDIDHFKQVNDRHGHAVGDQVLQAVARTLARSARGSEPAFRIGGEEFLLCCPGSKIKQASQAGERARRAIEQLQINTAAGELSVTVSVGVAERDSTMRRPDDLIKAADAALYQAKRLGRNRVCHDRDGWLPASEPASDNATLSRGKEPGALSAADAGIEPKALNILVADDDPSARVLYRRVLERAGHRLTEANDGKEAWDRLQHFPADLVILDGIMPGMSGIECIREIKRNSPFRDLPIILASGRSETDSIVEGLAAGADEYLTKPIDPRELLLRVNSVVRYRHALAASNAVRGEQSRALSLTAEFCWRLAAASTLDEVLHHTVYATSELTCSRGVAVALAHDRNELRVAKQLGYDEASVRNLPIARESGEIWRFYNLEDPDGSTARLLTGTHAAAPDAILLRHRQNVIVPLRAPGERLGVMVISGRHRDAAFTPLELEYIQLISNVASAAIQECLSRQALDAARDGIVLALAGLAESRDTDTGKHLERVTQFSLLLARTLQASARHSTEISSAFLQDLARAVPLHDIGKVAIPDAVLHKPGPLSGSELDTMRTHAAVGEQTIASLIARGGSASFLLVAREIAGAHHEWWNGNGYPRGLSGVNIPLAARITAVADVYDALTTRRPYKDPMPHTKARSIIVAASGSQFDPEVVAAFEQIESEFARLAIEFADEPERDAVLADDAIIAVTPALLATATGR